MTALEIANPRAPGPASAARSPRAAEGRRVAAEVAVSQPPLQPSAARPFVREAWVPWIFAAKTTLSALLTQLIAFTFNLDEPRWALLTVFIVAQPTTGMVLVKSFYRIIGTFTGVVAALVLVALFAQERVLFLGALAAWIGICTFASQYAKSVAAYAFVLSGYTAAIVGIPGALDPGNAFYVATARATEISLGIIVTAAVSQLIFPMSLAETLWREIAETRVGLADYALMALRGEDSQALRSKLLGEVVRIEDLHASAIFEERELRGRSEALRRLGAVFVEAFNSCQSLTTLRQSAGPVALGADEATAEASPAIAEWRSGRIAAAALGERLLRAQARLPLIQPLSRDASVSDEELMAASLAVARLRAFFACFAAFGNAYELLLSAPQRTKEDAPSATSADWRSAAWAGLRAGAAPILVATFWIMANWPDGPTAVILSAVVTARLATMNRAAEAAVGATVAVVLGTGPAFVVIEMLMSQASGFEMFAIVVAPVLFVSAFLMAHEKSPVAIIFGFLFALYFASVGGFANQTVYDPVGFINTSLAVIVAIAVGALLFSIVAPYTLEAARHRFARAARKALAQAADPASGITPAEFETTVVHALDPLRQHLAPQRPDAVAAWETGVALLGVGRELIAVAHEAEATPARERFARELAAFLSRPDTKRLERVRQRSRTVVADAIADLRGGALGASMTRAAASTIVAFATLEDELARGGDALVVH